MEIGTKVKTLVDCCGIPAGSVGEIDKHRGAVNPELYQVKLIVGGALFYAEEDLAKV